LVRRVSPASERIKGGTQPHFRLLQQVHAFGVLQGLGFQAHLRPGEFHAQRLDAPRGTQVTEERPEQRAGQERPGHDDVDEMRQGDQRLKNAR
jgi:hypothetical protein